jgi:hypothetical protein
MTDQHDLTAVDPTGDTMSRTGSDLASDAVIDDALAVIDAALARMMRRELVSTGEVADLLLDVRSLLTADHATVSDTPRDR